MGGYSEPATDVSSRDQDNQTPLHKAASSQNANPVMIKLLLEAGADVHAKDEDSQTPYGLEDRKDKQCQNTKCKHAVLKPGQNAF